MDVLCNNEINLLDNWDSIAMSKKYGLSLFDVESLSTVEMLIGHLTKVKKLYLISGNTEKVERLEKKLSDFSKKFDIEICVEQVDDMNNFFEVYLMLEKICERDGFPSWVNIANGSGMALSALSLHAYFKDAPLVMIDKYNHDIITTDVNKLKRIKIYKKRYFELINALHKKNQTVLDLAHLFEISTSAMSRRLKHLEMLNIVMRKGPGKANFPYIYQLTEFGKRLL